MSKWKFGRILSKRKVAAGSMQIHSYVKKLGQKSETFAHRHFIKIIWLRQRFPAHIDDWIMIGFLTHMFRIALSQSIIIWCSLNIRPDFFFVSIACNNCFVSIFTRLIYNRQLAFNVFPTILIRICCAVFVLFSLTLVFSSECVCVCVWCVWVSKCGVRIQNKSV